MKFFSKPGIHTSADNETKFFTYNIDALTINANQNFTCNASLTIILAWGNKNGKPNNLPTNWAKVEFKPLIFPTNWANVDGKPTVVPINWTKVEFKPVFATVATTRDWNDV